MDLGEEETGFGGRIWKGTYMNSLNTLKTFQRKFGDAPVPRMSSTANAGCPANRIAHDTCKKNVGGKENENQQNGFGCRSYLSNKEQ